MSSKGRNRGTMRRLEPGQTDVSGELRNLKHEEKQNKQLPKLPANTTINRRPINHASIASPFAGSKVQKVVYISRKTPVMSAVKRVKKFLREIEKRAMQSQGVDNVLGNGGRASRGEDRELHRRLDDVSEKLRRDAEEVLVKASGRAMEQALRIAEWFRNREEEISTKVDVRTGSVSVVDDIVEKDENEDTEAEAADNTDDEESPEVAAAMTVLDGGDTTMELLRNLENNVTGSAQDQNKNLARTDDQPSNNPGQSSTSEKPKSRRRKRKRAQYGPDDVPEARLRWVKTVEVAISLRA
ncbi:hypothetical protein LTS08_005333 [Lithohypha guttulata]|uniref:uncharacterized protein n=1 Tax=Lithohypha guttulata TaxID=1690604 RepID=UPI002DDFD030|nr:hypothetical protein LTR51_004967 [Lithohypha guttulata]KAK5100582.1 hypothetical protein LTS08_005333 [Lithohypha guttulata]